jgi:hypothetical protein
MLCVLRFCSLYRSTVGFDRMPPCSTSDGVEGLSNYPPYNIERTGENAYRIWSRSPASPTLTFDRDEGE